mmetsp:Transcript_42418/g.68852  ORF Transcript_42418/g.68852 Transcript_42418/m.68852 type:complete len:519 (+) Transcript_42418:15-1571(+)
MSMSNKEVGKPPKSPLAHAIRNGMAQRAKDLLTSKDKHFTYWKREMVSQRILSITEKDENGLTMMGVYAAFGHLMKKNILGLLQRAGGKVNEPCGPGGNRPLHYANSPGIVRQLLEEKADPTIVNDKNMSPLMLYHDPTWPPKGIADPLQNDGAQAQIILEDLNFKKEQLNLKDNLGRTCLHIATSALLNPGPPPDSEWPWSKLYHTNVWFLYFQIKNLLQAGADASLVNKDGDTAFDVFKKREMKNCRSLNQKSSLVDGLLDMLDPTQQLVQNTYQLLEKLRHGKSIDRIILAYAFEEKYATRIFFRDDLATNLFARLDLDNSGFIEENEFLAGFKNTTKGKKIFSAIDSNDDGIVGLTEFKEYLQEKGEDVSDKNFQKGVGKMEKVAEKAKKISARRDIIVSIFRILDIDRSGEIDREEVLKGVQTSSAQKKVLKLFDAINVSTSGAVTLREFTDYILKKTAKFSQKKFKQKMKSLMAKISSPGNARRIPSGDWRDNPGTEFFKNANLLTEPKPGP